MFGVRRVWVLGLGVEFESLGFEACGSRVWGVGLRG